MPPTWNRGMKFRQTSSDVRPDEAAMAVAPRTSWRCVVMGTTFFLPVEPDVCSTSATRASWPPAFGDLAAGDLGAAPEKGVSPPLDTPAPGVGKSRGVPAAAAGASKSASWNGPPTPSVRYGSPASVNAPPTCASGVMASGAMPGRGTASASPAPSASPLVHERHHARRAQLREHLLRGRARIHGHSSVPVHDTHQHGHELGAVRHSHAHARPGRADAPRFQIRVGAIHELAELGVRHRSSLVHGDDRGRVRKRQELAHVRVARDLRRQPVALQRAALHALGGGAGDDGAQGRRRRRSHHRVSRKAVRGEGVGGGRRRRRGAIPHGVRRPRAAGAPRGRRRLRRGHRPGLRARGPAPVPAHLLLRHVRRLAHKQGGVQGIFPRARLRRAGGLVELVPVVGARATRATAVHGRVDQLGGVPEPRLGVIQQVRHPRMSIDASASRDPPREKRRAHSRVRGPNSRTCRATGASPRRRLALTVTAAKSALEVARRRPRPPSRRDVRGAGRVVAVTSVDRVLSLGAQGRG